MTADPLVYDRKNKRKILTHIDGRKQYFTLNNNEIESPEQPYSDELRRSMWKAYQLGREYNHSHDQVMSYMRSWPQMNKTILDEIAQRGTEAIPDVESSENLPLHKPYKFKSDSDIRDIRRSEDEDAMSEAYHSVRFNGGSQADAEKAQQPARQLTEEEIVNGVLHGDYKNGTDRINELRALGLSNAEIKHIQDIVNARIYAGRAIVQRKKTAPRAPKRVSRQQMYNGFPVNYRPY